jgi:L-threonylcarbamoyladenylate synthase
MKSDWQKAIKILKKEGVVVLPTDTLYGIVGKAQSKKVVERIYKIKDRSENKPFIVLITSFKDLEIFEVRIDKEQAKFLEKIWPGKVSVILSCKLLKYNYLHRDEKAIAFRMIGKKNLNLFNLIKKVGPLVAPSANKQGERPAENIAKAKKYFGDEVDLYINAGTKKSTSSTLIKYENKNRIVLRQGIVKI